MVRFFVKPDEMQTDVIRLDSDNAAHAKVLRIKIGDEILVCDGEGQECLCTVTSVENSAVLLSVQHRYTTENEAAVKVSVYVAFPKADKLEHIIQKATELGAYEIVVFPSNRCVSKPDEKSIIKKMERWQKIAVAASEQSGRGVIPDVVVLRCFADAVNRATSADKAILFYENENATTLHMALENSAYHTISLLTGPEGGLEVSEVELARNAGMHICTLGKRILRCETAPLCALSAVMYQAGEF